ncbi:MAG TPA: 3D domain-containing protein [bacterium]|nr:3D domain-containing protein [bacterium]
MTTIAFDSHPRLSSNGGISALIVCVGLAIVFGAALYHVSTATHGLVDPGVTPSSSAHTSEYRFVTEGQRAPHDLRASPTLSTPRSLRGVIQPRRTVLIERLYRVTVVDGITVSQTLIGERSVRTPLDQLMHMGTWVQTASRGLFAGYEYLDMVATAYAPHCCRGVGEITATGMKAGPGVVAVDPAVIPLGSHVYVEGYGHAIAGDIGGAIKGRRIDLGFATKNAALQYGVQRVRVYLLTPN